MKKLLAQAIRSIAAITVMVISTAAAPQARAQGIEAIQKIQEEIQQVVADFQAEKITIKQYEEKMKPLMQEMEIAKKARDQEIEARDKAQQAETKRKEDASPKYTAAQLRRMEALMEQMQSLTAQYNEKRISKDAYEKQVVPLSNEYKQIYDPLEKSPAAQKQFADSVAKPINDRWPGQTPGWPPADNPGDRTYLVVGGLSRPLRQAAGTRASYSITRPYVNGPIDTFRIYQTGANQAAFDDLRRQIESITGKTFEKREDGSYELIVVVKEERHLFYEHRLSISSNGTLAYHIYDETLVIR